MAFLVRTRRIGDVAGRHGIESPQTRRRNGTALLVVQRAERRTGADIVRINPAIAEIADKQRSGKLIEGRRGDGHAPRRIQRTARGNELLQKRSALAENVDRAEPGAVFLVDTLAPFGK